MTTHSPVAVRELSGNQIFVVRKNTDETTYALQVGVNDDAQSTVRADPGHSWRATSSCAKRGERGWLYTRPGPLLDLHQRRFDAGGGMIELMPVAGSHQYAFKYVNGHLSNTFKDLHTVMAFGVLTCVETGYPALRFELTIATTLRTAATSLMAAKALARPNSRKMAPIGNGAQSEFQALAFHKYLGIQKIVAYDTDSLATAKLIRNLQEHPELKTARAQSVAEALREADIITTVTADKAYATTITAEMLEPGIHLNAVGGDCPGKTELHADVLRKARAFVEYEPQIRIRRGYSAASS